jgi:hypothetical protein
VRVYYDIASTDIGTHDVNIEYLLLNTWLKVGESFE